MRCVYLSGPMRHYPGDNFAVFDRAAEEWRSVGFAVINPAAMDRNEPVSAIVAYPQSPDALRHYAIRDTECILSLRPERGDLVATLPGWEHSVGAQAEVALARWVGVPVVSHEAWQATVSSLLKGRQ